MDCKVAEVETAPRHMCRLGEFTRRSLRVGTEATLGSWAPSSWRFMEALKCLCSSGNSLETNSPVNPPPERERVTQRMVEAVTTRVQCRVILYEFRVFGRTSLCHHPAKFSRCFPAAPTARWILPCVLKVIDKRAMESKLKPLLAQFQVEIQVSRSRPKTFFGYSTVVLHLCVFCHGTAVGGHEASRWRIVNKRWDTLSTEKVFRHSN